MWSGWLKQCPVKFSVLEVVLLLLLLMGQPSSCRPPIVDQNNDDIVPQVPANELDVEDNPKSDKKLPIQHEVEDSKGAIEPDGKPDDEKVLRFKGEESNNAVEQPGPPLKLDKQAFDSFEKNLIELSKNQPRLAMKDVMPPDHLDGVRLEQDGHINKEYKKEVLFGNHEEFEEASDDELEKKLLEIYDLMDTDRNEKITKYELSAWIQLKVKEHFEEAIHETDDVFKHLDSNQDGMVAWTEFHMHFLLAKGMHPKEAAKHVVDYYSVDVDSDVKERLIRYKFRWAEADEEPQDNKLNREEFANFRHPERSTTMLKQLVKELLESLDKNGDGVITETEFIALPPGEVDEAYQESDRVWQNERRKEFKEVIDLNKDGVLNSAELQNYVDPGNPSHSEMEAENLIALADEDNDGMLSRREVIENMELFLGSKVIDTGKNFHDEF